MTTDTALIEKREELKRRLTVGEYKTLVDVFLAWTNRVIQKITRQTKPLPLWLMTVFLGLVINLIFSGVVYISGNLITIRHITEMFGIGYGLYFLLVSNSVFIIAITPVIIINQFIHRVIVLWRDDILDATESVQSLQEFEDWLEKVCNLRLHFLVVIFVGLLTSFAMLAITNTQVGVFSGYGSIFGIISPNMVGASFVYQFTMVILLQIMLRSYDLKLFAADPATSELLSRLSGELTFIVYFIAFFSAFLTLGNVVIGTFRTVGIFLVLVLWLPIIAMFILNQTSLSGIVRRAKWKSLNEVQAKIEKLRTSKSFGSPQTMDTISKLMDYHDRVKATRNSALNSGAILSFVNSLLLPLLAFLLGNLDKLMTLLPQRP